jgi:hypothetical protein
MGFETQQGQETLFPPVPSRQTLVPIQPRFNGYRASFPGVKRPAREACHSPPSSAEVKKEWSLTSTPPLCFSGEYRCTF